MKETCQDEKKEDKRAGNNGDTLQLLAGMAGKWGKKAGGKKTGGKVIGGGATGDKIKKPINKKDEDGNQL